MKGGGDRLHARHAGYAAAGLEFGEPEAATHADVTVDAREDGPAWSVSAREPRAQAGEPPNQQKGHPHGVARSVRAGATTGEHEMELPPTSVPTTARPLSPLRAVSPKPCHRSSAAGRFGVAVGTTQEEHGAGAVPGPPGAARAPVMSVAEGTHTSGSAGAPAGAPVLHGRPVSRGTREPGASWSALVDGAGRGNTVDADLSADAAGVICRPFQRSCLCRSPGFLVQRTSCWQPAFPRKRGYDRMGDFGDWRGDRGQWLPRPP